MNRLIYRVEDGFLSRTELYVVATDPQVAAQLRTAGYTVSTTMKLGGAFTMYVTEGVPSRALVARLIRDCYDNMLYDDTQVWFAQDPTMSRSSTTTWLGVTAYLERVASMGPFEYLSRVSDKWWTRCPELSAPWDPDAAAGDLVAAKEELLRWNRPKPWLTRQIQRAVGTNEYAQMGAAAVCGVVFAYFIGLLIAFCCDREFFYEMIPFVATT